MKKKHEEPEQEAKNERWLLTYSDMITLLLALFIILYSMSSIEVKKLEDLAKNFGNAFHTSDKNTAKNGEGMGFGSGGSETSSSAETVSGANVDGGTDVNPLDDIYLALTKYINDNHLSEDIQLNNNDTFVRIHLKDQFMFIPDSPNLLTSSYPVIQKIGDAMKGVYDYVDHITISGHTADVGEHNEQTDAFSWNLSINRADNVRRFLVENGLKEEKISLEGYGHYAPVASNDTEEGRAKNRRVEIIIYKYKSALPATAAK